MYAIRSYYAPIEKTSMLLLPGRRDEQIVDDLNDELKGQRGHSQRHEEIGDPELGRPDGVGHPASFPGLGEISPYVEGYEPAEQSRQDVGDQVPPPVPPRGQNAVSYNFV